MYESAVNNPALKSSTNIYLVLLQIYLNPQKTTKNIEKRINQALTRNTSTPRLASGASFKSKGVRSAKKIAAIEGAEDMRFSLSGTDSSKSDGDADEVSEEGGSSMMMDQVLSLLGRRWDRINGALALRLLPRDTKLQVLQHCYHRSAFVITSEGEVRFLFHFSFLWSTTRDT